MTTGHQNPTTPHSSPSERIRARPVARNPWPIRVAISVAAAVVGIAVMGIGYEVLYSGRVYPGVKVGNVQVGSMAMPQLQATLEEKLGTIAGQSVVLDCGGQEFSQSAEELGIRFDAEKTAHRAMQVGRDGSLLQQMTDRLAALTNGKAVAPAFRADEIALDNFIRRVAEAVDTPARDASLIVRETGAEIAASSVGVKVDVEATKQRLRDAVAEGLPDRVAVVAEVTRPQIVEADLTEARAAAQRIVSAPITLTYDQRTWTISPAELAAMVEVAPTGHSSPAGLTASLSPRLVSERIASIAKEIDRPPRNAEAVLERDHFVASAGQEGFATDVAASTAATIEASLGTNRAVTLKVNTLKPLVSSGDLAAAVTRANKMISAPIVLKLDNRSWTLSRAQLIEMAKIEEVPDLGRVEAVFDGDKLTDYLSALAAEVNCRPRNARIQLRGSEINVIGEGQDGITLKVAETAAAIASQARTDNRVVTLQVDIEKPKLTAEQAGSIVIKDLLAKASTSYAGSIPERAHNVRLATSRLNGVLVAPGDEFSFNDELGPVTLQSGYQIGYAIAMTNGQMQTVPSEGGGICQVATTVFHAAFWAGLDITQRYPHMYWMPRYGQPPLGMKGLDATVDQAYGVDLRFRNNTGNWIALISSADSSNIYFSIYGTKPNWEVKVEGPFISNIVPADTKLIRQEDPTLAPGREILVEHAEDGFDCSVVRTVVKDGQVIDRREFRSHYSPARNVLLVGPQAAPTPPAPPAPSASPTPSTTPVPQPAGTPTPPGPTPTPVSTPPAR